LAKQPSNHNKINNFQRIRELGHKQQGLLALMLLERMKPNYQLFAELTEYPQPHNLDNMLNSLWERLLVKGAKVSLGAMEEKIEALTPDEHDFDMYGVYPAIYFCTALLTYINGEMDEESYDPVAISKISQGCIVHLLETQADEELDNAQLREHELMQLEVGFLSDSLHWLEAFTFKGKDFKAIKGTAMARVFADGVTNIGIEIDMPHQ